MLTGDEKSNSGRSFIDGLNLDKFQDRANQIIGYCP